MENVELNDRENQMSPKSIFEFKKLVSFSVWIEKPSERTKKALGRGAREVHASISFGREHLEFRECNLSFKVGIKEADFVIKGDLEGALVKSNLEEGHFSDVYDTKIKLHGSREKNNSSGSKKTNAVRIQGKIARAELGASKGEEFDTEEKENKNYTQERTEKLVYPFTNEDEGFQRWTFICPSPPDFLLNRYSGHITDTKLLRQKISAFVCFSASQWLISGEEEKPKVQRDLLKLIISAKYRNELKKIECSQKELSLRLETLRKEVPVL